MHPAKLSSVQRNVASWSGAACLLVGGAALLGLLVQVPALVRISDSFYPMAANTAITFVVDGVALLLMARGWTRVAGPAAGWTTLIGVASLVEHGFRIDLGIDQWLIADTLSHSSTPGRLAPNTSAAFVLAGVGLYCCARRVPGRHTAQGAGVLGAIVAAIGMVSVLGYVSGHPTYVWGGWTRMAANTGAALVALGLGVLAEAWSASAGRDAGAARWPAVAVFCSSLTMTVTIAFALGRELQSHAETVWALLQLGPVNAASALPGVPQLPGYLITAIVSVGILISVLLALLVDMALTGSRHAAALQRANDKLETEVRQRRRVEQELLHSEERFRGAFEQAPHGMCLSGTDGQLLQVNRAFCVMVGRSEQELHDGCWAELTHPADLEISRAVAGELLSGRRPSVEFEKRYIDSHGRILWVRVKTLLLRDQQGAPSHFITHVEDITARRDAEIRLRQREERFRAAFDCAPFGLVLSTFDRKFVEVNASFRRLLGYSAEEFESLGWDEITHPADRSISPEAIIRLRRDRLEWVEFEKRYVHKDGHAIWTRVRLSLAPEISDRWRFVTHVEDITERKRAEDKALASEERVRQLLDSTAEGIYGLDLEGRCTFANPACAEMLGYPDVGALIGKDLHELIHHTRADGRPYPVEDCRICRSFRGGERVHVDDEVFWRAGGTCFPAEYWSHPVRSGGALVGSVVAMLDITERKAAETALLTAKELAETANRAKSRFLANMSHEIRTPMNGIIGMAHLLLDSELAPPQRHCAEVARSCAVTLKSLLDHVLDLSKIEAGKVTLECLDFDLREVLAGVVEMLAIQAGRKGLELTCLVAPETPSLLRGDPGRLRQVLGNLVANAVKFTERGDVGIRVTLAGSGGNGVQLHFAIRDTGIGIPKARAGALFSPFVQADESTTRKYGGTGLGLAISRQLVEMMDGRIGFDSEEGRGSTFWFTAAFGKQRAASPVADATPKQLEGCRALIVDDSDASREMLAVLLRAWGCRPDEAATAAAAMELLGQASAEGDPFAVALIDRNMPDSDGAALARQVAADPVLRLNAVVLLAPFGEHGPGGEFAGASLACLSKPVLEGRLRTVLAEVLERTRVPKTVNGSCRPGAPLVRRPSCPFRVLLAEDNMINQQVLVAMLVRRGFTVEAVVNGAEALRALHADRYELVLMDCEMPEMDGFEATRRIRKGEAGQPNTRIPIVAVTANAMPGDRERCLRSGMDDSLPKPIEPEDLFRVLGKWTQAPAETPQEPPQEPATFDEAGFLKRLMGNRKLAGQLVKAFLDDAPAQLSRLRQQIAEGDSSGARRQAHSLKGAAANLSAGALRAAAWRAEQAASAGQLAGLADCIAAMETEVEQFRTQMQRLNWA
jgi:PAS domain S-box-containing protein